MRGKRAKVVILLALLIGGFSSAAADVLVLRSTGPSAKDYPAGRRFPDAFTFRLRPGDTVAVLGKTGTRLFRGPGEYAVVRPPQTGQLPVRAVRPGTGAVRGGEALRPSRRRSAGAAPRRSARPSTGAVRGIEIPALARPTNVWLADVSQSGRVCVRAGEPLTLWRPDPAQATVLTVTAQDGTARELAWAAGQQTLTLPSDFPVQNGSTYQLTQGEAARSTRITIVGVQAALEDREAIASTLLAERCSAQLDVFIAISVDPEDSEESEPAAPRAGER